MRYYIYIYNNFVYIKKPLENTKGQSKMDNPEKLVTQGTQDDEKQNANTMCMLRIKNTKTLWFLSGFPRQRVAANREAT